MIAPAVIETLVTLLQGLVILLGAFLSFQAYRGYRRYGDQRMAFTALGIAFLTVLPGLLAVTTALFPIGSDSYLLLFEALLYLVGLGALDYALNHTR